MLQFRIAFGQGRDIRTYYKSQWHTAGS